MGRTAYLLNSADFSESAIGAYPARPLICWPVGTRVLSWATPEKHMSTKFAKFLEESKINQLRLQAASRHIERLTGEDRAFLSDVARKRALAGRKDAANVAVEKKKLHSGRPITPRLVDDASLGKPVSGTAKTRLLRAVNRILEQRKQPPVTIRELF